MLIPHATGEMMAGETVRFHFRIAPKIPVPDALFPKEFILNRMKAKLYDVDDRLEFLFWDEPTEDTFIVDYRVHEPNPVPVAIIVAIIVGIGTLLALTVTFNGFEKLVSSPEGAKVARSLATGAAVTGSAVSLGLVAAVIVVGFLAAKGRL